MKILLNFLQVSFLYLLISGCQQTIAENTNAEQKTSSIVEQKDIIEIIKKYELPAALNEISGMVWIGEKTFACVQDEDGIIFIYDIDKEKITKEIKFADYGDYEGLALYETTVYVQRADGVIFMVTDFLGANPLVKEYKTNLTAKQNIEGIEYDAKNNRLLSVIKDKEPGKVDYKGVYAFNLNNYKMGDKPVFKLPANDERYKMAGLKKDTFYPSGISMYKPTGHYFMVDGRQAGLLEMDEKGKVLKVYDLGTKNFSQAESITFDDKGNIFISSEAGKDKAHITQIKIAE